MRGEKETACATGWITDRHIGFWSHHLNHRLDEGTWGEILACAAFDIFGVFLQESFINFAFDINIHSHPGFPINEIDDALELGRVLNFVLRFAKDHTQHPISSGKFSEDVPVMVFEGIAVFFS